MLLLIREFDSIGFLELVVLPGVREQGCSLLPPRWRQGDRVAVLSLDRALWRLELLGYTALSRTNHLVA